jgi:integrase
MLERDRRRMGHNVFVLSPQSAAACGFNVLDWIDIASPLAEPNVDAVVEWICGYTSRRDQTAQFFKDQPRSRKSATCPVAALEAWLTLVGEQIGNDCVADSPDVHTTPVFRRIDHGRITADRLTGRAVAEIVKRAAKRVGIDPSKVAGHSLRSGFATSAARGGASLADIMAQTGHKNSDIAMRYVQRGKILQNPASKAVRL